MKSLFRKVTETLVEISKKRKEAQKRKKKSTPKGTRPLSGGESQTMRVDFPTLTVIKVVLVVYLFLIFTKAFVLLQTIVIITGISFFLAMMLSPLVDKIEEYRFPRPIAILLLYIIFFGVVGVLFIEVIPILTQQLLQIANDITDVAMRFLNSDADIPILHNVLGFIQFDTQEFQNFIGGNIRTITSSLQNIAGSTFGILSGIFQGVFNFIYALVLIFFILMEREDIGNFFLSLLPTKNHTYLHEKFAVVQSKTARWFRGQMILMLSIGTAMYIGMKLLEWTLGMQYAGTIALVAGIMELFPYIGVIITGILAGIIALNISWVLFVAIIAWMAFIQFLEGNVLVPIIMEKVVGLSSVVVILAIATGGILGNAIGGVALSILGMILSIPIAASVAIFVQEYAQRQGK